MGREPPSSGNKKPPYLSACFDYFHFCLTFNLCTEAEAELQGNGQHFFMVELPDMEEANGIGKIRSSVYDFKDARNSDTRL